MLLLLVFISISPAQKKTQPYQPKAFTMPAPGQQSSLKRLLRFPFAKINRSDLKTGILHDRVLSFNFVTLRKLDGRKNSPAINFGDFKNLYFEMENAALPPFASRPLPLLLQEITAHLQTQKSMPLLIADFEYETVAEDALARGNLRENQAGQFEIEPAVPESPFVQHRLFMAVTPKTKIYHRQVEFQLSEDFHYGNSKNPLQNFEIDFADGLGVRALKISNSL